MNTIHTTPVQFGRVTVITSDRNNLDSVRQLTNLLFEDAEAKNELYLGSTNTCRSPEENGNAQPTTVILEKEDALDFLNNQYGIHPTLLPFNKPMLPADLAATDPYDQGMNAFFGDYLDYIHTGQDPVTPKIFNYTAEKLQTNGGNDVTGKPILNIVV